VEALIHDGRISAEKYSLKLSNDSLFINGDLQPDDVLDTYAPQLNGLTKFQVDYIKQVD
jgi:hypothetical protein